MRKGVATILVIIMIFTVSACGKNKKTSEMNSGDSITQTESDTKEALVSSENAQQEDAESMTQQYWEGDWYGFWRISSAKGFWELITEAEGDCWDGCARITMLDSVSGHFSFWSEVGTGGSSAETPLISCDVSFGTGTTVAGSMISEKVSFFEDTIENADWSIDPGMGDVSKYDHMICIRGIYEDEKQEGFVYEIYLRPWGMEWDDVVTDEPDSIPYHYIDWYLPAIRSDRKMPDEILEDGFADTGDQLDNQNSSQDSNEMDLNLNGYMEPRVFVEWADDTAENAGYEEYTFGQSRISQPQASILFTSDYYIDDFVMLTLDLEEVADNGNIYFSTYPEYPVPEISPEHPLLVKLTFDGDIPTVGFQYTDPTSNLLRRFTLEISGEDGTLVTREANRLYYEFVIEEDQPFGEVAGEHLVLEEVANTVYCAFEPDRVLGLIRMEIGQFSLDGNAYATFFTEDGKTLWYGILAAGGECGKDGLTLTFGEEGVGDSSGELPARVEVTWASREAIDFPTVSGSGVSYTQIYRDYAYDYMVEGN